MIGKQINTCEFLNICQTNCNGTLEDTEVCHCYELYKQLKHKDKELQEAMNNYVQLDLQRVKEYNELVDLYETKEQKCEKLKTEIAFGNNGTLSDKIRAEVFKELNNENNQLKAENEELKKKIKYMEEYIKTVENSRNEFEKESKFLKEEIQKL